MSEATSSQAVEIWIPAMIRRSIATVLKFGAVVCLLFALLFADGPGVTIYGFIGSVIREITAVLRDLDTQWMVFLCLGIYFTAFVVLRRKARLASRLSQRGDPTAWLTVSLFVAAVVYAFNYSPSTQAVTLMAGAVIGQGFGFGGGFITQNSVADEVTRLKSKSSQSLLTSSATILVVLLALVSVWQAEAPHTFAYHGQARWSGPWENPNLAGLLMGAGAVLATGLGLRGWRMEMLSPQSTVRNLSCSLRSLRLKENWLVVGGVLFYVVAAILMVRALFHSYSRGAWVGTACGTAYLIGSGVWGLGFGKRPDKSEIGNRKSEISFGSCISWLRNNWLPASVILASVLLFSFWQFRQTEWHPVRRAVSVANANDFSWRKRVAAWEGALQMMAEKPGFGFGWNQPQRMYDQFYRAPKIDEAAAIEMNDYLMLGSTLGIPALVCFGMYVWLSLTQNGESRKQKLKTRNRKPETGN